MREIDPLWTPYRSELDPQRRLDILDAMGEAGQGFCREIFHGRYRRLGRDGRWADGWLWRCICLPGLSCRGSSLLSRRGARREMRAVLRELFLDRAEDLAEDETTALYWEFRNVARRYLSTCRADGYASSFFGMKRATEEEKRARAREDILAMSQGVAQAFGLEEDMALWCAALRDELMDHEG